MLQSPQPVAALKAKALFVGVAAPDIAAALGDRANDLEIAQSHGTADTIALVIRSGFDYVVIDQSVENPARALLVPLLAGSEQQFKLIVICQAADVGTYLRMRGVDRVLAQPLAVQQLLMSLDVREKPVKETAAAVHSPTLDEPLRPHVAVRWRNRGVAVVSSFYKNAAFVLLAVLFLAFCFYGLLIAYFLLSSSWGAPVTLSSGHELVARVEQQINELKVNANLASQHKSEAELESAKASRAQEDARLLVGYVLGTVEKEIKSRTARRKTLLKAERRLMGLKSAFEKQLAGAGMSNGLSKLYKKRLIDRRTFSAETLNILDAGQKLSNLEGNLADVQDEGAAFDANIKMLEALSLQLRGGAMQSIEAASTELILLTKQAVDARSAYDQSKAQVKSADSRKNLLGNSQALLEGRIAELEKSAPGRAIGSRVDVIFVPYGNEKHFQKGSPLYTCALTVVLCHRAGTVGKAVPGESTAVHPFFGKPIRGYFVEALLDDETAASQEIIHAERPPFFF